MITAIIAIAVVTILAFISLILLRKRHNQKPETRYNQKQIPGHFERNGGLLLERQLAATGVIGKTQIFSSETLKTATDGFNERRVLGRGGQGTVYKGVLADGRNVAIKKSMKVDESLVGQFINELVTLSQINHNNVVKLLGCCLETQVPLLVYEFIGGGTLFNLLHDNKSFPFTWSLRLKIATEVAEALAYLHSQIPIPVLHRDIKSSNILLNEKNEAKVSDFGASVSIAIGKTHKTTRVQEKIIPFVIMINFMS